MVLTWPSSGKGKDYPFVDMPYLVAEYVTEVVNASGEEKSLRIGDVLYPS